MLELFFYSYTTDIRPTCGVPCLKECPEGRQVDKYGCPLCECRLNPCTSEPCKNDGECFHRGDDFYCLCPSGYGGKVCDEASSACPGY